MKFYHWFPVHPNSSVFSGDAKKIKDIGEGLLVVDSDDKDRLKQNDLRRISSVPDIWSQHQLFHMMLTNTQLDDSYIEYEEIVVREWRAMLAVLLLAESYDVKIRMETIDFTKGAKNPFISAAYKVRPKAKNWDGMDIYYIEDGGEQYPIAMSSPTVHIVPTKDAWEKLNTVYPGRIPWLKGGKVHPLVEKAEDAELVETKNKKNVYTPGMVKTGKDKESPAISQIHALVLKRWLDVYSERTAGKALLENQLIQDYSNALASAYDLDTANSPNIDGVVNGSQNGWMQIRQVPVPKPFKLFSDTVRYAMIEQGVRYDKLTDAHKNAGGLGEECIKSLPSGEEYVQYFIPMPVTDMFWNLWDKNAKLNPEYKIDIVAKGEDIALSKIRATVTIGDIMFSREYKGNIEEIAWHKFCTAGIWPRQRINGWSKYFMFCVESNRYSLIPDDEDGIREKLEYRLDPTTMRAEGRAIDKTEAKGQEERETRLTYYMLRQMPNRCKLFCDDELLGYVTTRRSDPIGIASASKNKPELDKVAQADQANESNPVKTAESPRVAYEAALDFGTSSTTIFGRTETGMEALVTGLNFWSMPLINPKDSFGADTPYFAKYFVPAMPPAPKDIALEWSSRGYVLPSYKDIQDNAGLESKIAASFPLQSILADAVDSNTSRQPLYHSWIFYRAFMGKRYAVSWPQLYPNLKWCQSGDNDQKRVEAMLMQLLYMIALEAKCKNCNELALTASYPLTFTNEVIRSYFSSLSSALKVVADNTGLTIRKPKDATDSINPEITEAVGGTAKDAAQGADAIARITESEAAFRYAVSKDEKGVSYYVIDIGGGSADIFISAVNNGISHYYSSSIRFGARKILLEGLLDNRASRLNILVRQAEDSIKKMYDNIDEYIDDICKSKRSNGESGIEDLLGMSIPINGNYDTQVHSEKTFGDAYAVYCAGKSSETPDGKLLLELKKRIAFYLAATVFCAGLMIRDETDIAKDSATIVLAGNGSKMIHWLHSDTTSKTEFVGRILQAGMRSSIAQDEFRYVFSREPKLEVASGALKKCSEVFGSDKRPVISQVTFGHATETDSTKKRSINKKAHEKTIEAGQDEFKELLKAYKDACIECFGWSFKQDEYAAEIFDAGGRKKYVQELLKSCTATGDSFMIGAVDALSRYYLAGNV